MKVRQTFTAPGGPRVSRLSQVDNLIRYNADNVHPVVYPRSVEGVIHSSKERYTFDQEFYEEVMGEWAQTKDYLRFKH